MSEQLESLLSFRIGQEHFAFDTFKVRNILEMSHITKVPKTKSFILGIVNLHGNIIPVVDFRMMLGVSTDGDTSDTSIVVTSVDGNNDSYIGYVVDKVDEVFGCQGMEIKENVAVDDNNELSNAFLGNVFVKEQFVHIIDLVELSQLVEL